MDKLDDRILAVLKTVETDEARQVARLLEEDLARVERFQHKENMLIMTNTTTTFYAKCFRCKWVSAEFVSRDEASDAFLAHISR